MTAHAPGPVLITVSLRGTQFCIDVVVLDFVYCPLSSVTALTVHAFLSRHDLSLSFFLFLSSQPGSFT